jgi:hypothetical protein
MTQQIWPLVAVGAYFLLFMGAAVGFLLLKVKRRGGRAPVAFKLLRAPGETLRRRISKFDEDFAERMGLAALVPIIALIPVLGVFIYWKPQTWTDFWLWSGATLLVFVGTLGLSLKWAMTMLTRYRADRLGYLGEREVAERLMPLWTQGYRLFHDVPAEGAKRDFNVDHVAIGPTGVAIIETKTRRKAKQRSDGSEYRVRYDGEKLLWPWGPDFDSTNQAVAIADWTRKFIHERTGIDVTVKPVVAIPGWWVDSRPGAVLVVNAKSAETAVKGDGKVMLTEPQIDLIARQFDERCRDVED